MTDNTMREGKLWAFLRDSIHEAYKKLSTTGTSTEYHAMLDSIAAKVADDVDARFLQTCAAELQRLRKKLASAERERDQSNTRLHEVAVACATAERERDDAHEIIDQYKGMAARYKACMDERDDLRKDAERYRWLRDGNDNKKSAACHIAVNCYGLEWDDAIDAAIAQEGE